MSKEPPPPDYNATQGYPPQGYPPQGYPPQGYPPQAGGYPPPGQGYPPQQQAYPGPSYPPQGGYEPSGYATGPKDSYYPQQQQQSVAIAMVDDGDDMIRRGNVGLSDPNIRRSFIRKVYLILLIQFGVTAATILVMKKLIGTRDEMTHDTHQKVFIAMWVSFAVFIITEIVLVCCDSVRRKHPLNLFLLAIFTFAMSGFVGCITLYYSVDAVLIAMGSTCIIVLGLTLFAMQTKIDLTSKGMYIFAIFLVFFCFGFFAIFFYSRILQVVYGCLGVLVFSLFLVYDTQMLIGGRKYELTEEEYVFAAITIYIDVIQIFLYILSILGNDS